MTKQPRSWIDMETRIGNLAFGISARSSGSVDYHVAIYGSQQDLDEDPVPDAAAYVGREDFLAMLTLARTEKELASLDRDEAGRP